VNVMPDWRAHRAVGMGRYAERALRARRTIANRREIATVLRAMKALARVDEWGHERKSN